MIALKQFALAGNATFTVTSKKTGTRFTFRIRKPSDESPHFVSLLNGPDNENSYCFLGTIFNGEKYFHGKKSRVGQDAPSAQAFQWIWRHISDPVLEEKIEVAHAGKCGKCGRLLTDPQSISIGIGPICREQMGFSL